MKNILIILFLSPLITNAQWIDIEDYLPIFESYEREVTNQVFVVGDQALMYGSEFILIDSKASIVAKSEGGPLIIHFESLPVGYYYLYSDKGVTRYLVVH